LTLFVDASALVAMIAGEREGEALAEAMRAADDPLWSAMSCWEAVVALRKARGISLEAAREEVEAIATVMPFRLVEIGEEERRIALDAHAIYGKGRHAARLNMGDCFAYACAKTNGATLLYKGNDFSYTDLA
jgi:ribonuclease VapC